MYSTHEADLDLPSLPLAARRVHIVPALSSSSLLSMGQLCDAGCRVTFDAQSVHVHLNDEPLLSGTRDHATGLWHLGLSADTSDTAPPDGPATATCLSQPPLLHHSYAATHSATPGELVAFAHAALFSPVLSTLTKALERGYLPQCMGLTAQTLRKHPLQSIAMVKGHLDQTRKNQRSTKAAPPLPPLPEETEISDDVDAFPPSDPGNARTHQCYSSIVEPSRGQIYSDQTGKFVVASSTSNNYILVVYDYDSNSILVEPMRSRTGPCILAAFTVIHARLVAAGLRPQLQRLDNECSEALKTFLTKETIKFQLVPPKVHRRNAAERAIRTFKNHFVAGLCSVNKDFPLHLWDKLLPQAELTLNLLRGSRINPKLSAHAQMHGHFDFNQTPIAPPGIRVLVHIKPTERTTWSPHGADGWYTGPALELYRCYTVWLWDTRTTRICDTLAWFPTKVTMPIASSNDLILAGIGDILQALKNPSPGSTLAPLTDSLHEALVQLTSILTSIASPPQTIFATDTPTLRDPVETISDAPLRVAVHANHPPPPIPAPSIPDPSLRVPISPPIGPKRVQFATLPTTSRTTFDNSTGATGSRRRREQRKRAATRPLSAAKTVHPSKTTPRAPPPHVSSLPMDMAPALISHGSHTWPHALACYCSKMHERHSRRLPPKLPNVHTSPFTGMQSTPTPAKLPSIGN